MQSDIDIEDFLPGLESFEQSRFPSLYEQALTLPAGNDPRAVSSAVIDAVFSATAAIYKGGILINSSTGKDSTLMTSLVIEGMERRIKVGDPICPVMIGISDTRSEFPEVATRMRDERDSINAYATRNALPIEAMIVGPNARKSLLVEIIGNGLALPQLKNSTAAMVGASWCMDRVKRNPLDSVLKIAQSRFSHVVQMIGTRSDESTRRSYTVSKYSNGLPFGLTRISGSGSHISGCVPIVHWLDSDIKNWMITHLVCYDMFSADNLRAIYSKGSTSAELAGECSITVTKEGGVTSVCSDLGGARFGCWMCLLSTNKSLRNTAKRDDRYIWLRKFHNYLFLHHSAGDKRRRLRDALGFTPETLFPKGFLMRERIFLLMLVFRAEIESGFELLDSEQLTAIQSAWDRHGFADLSVDRIRELTRVWRRTGKPPLDWLSDDDDSFALELATTLSGGVISQQMSENASRANALNLVAGAGGANPLYPRTMAWVFADPRDPERQTVMVSDSINTLGGKTNGLILGNWTCLGMRYPMAWESKMADGRAFFYVITREHRESLLGSGITPDNSPILQSLYANNSVRKSGSQTHECPISSGLLLQHEAASCSLSAPDFTALFHLVSVITDLSDIIEHDEMWLRSEFDRVAKVSGLGDYGLVEKHGRKMPADVLAKCATLRSALTPAIRAIGSDYAVMRQKLADVIRLMRANDLPSALVVRLAYITRTLPYDENYASEMLQQLTSVVVKCPTRRRP